MKTLHGILLLSAIVNSHQLVAQNCSVSYDSVSPQSLAYFRVTGIQHGIILSGAFNGSIATPRGGNGTFTWAPATSKLFLVVTSLPLLVSCSRATDEFNDFVNGCKAIDTIKHVASSPSSDVWRIDSPNVLQPDTAYPQIRFSAGDKVEIEAGGWVGVLRQAATGTHGGSMCSPATTIHITD